LNAPDHRAALAAQLPAGFTAEAEPVFAEPWQAQAFAMALALLENGSFSWQEWASTLGAEIATAAEHGIAEDGSAYYELWLRALERLVADKQLASAQELGRLKQDWKQAYASTPHGQPVVLARG
jgi:nitrile hydratase accessory protein